MSRVVNGKKLPNSLDEDVKKLRPAGQPSSMAKEVHMDYCYNRYAYKTMIQGEVGRLRARILNLADSSIQDKESRQALKGLIKDFFNQAYYPLIRDIEKFLVDYNVLPEDIFNMGSGGIDELARYENN